MSRVLVLKEPRTLAFDEVEERALAPAEVRVRTRYSGISAGTELAAYRGTTPFGHKAWDPKLRLFAPGRTEGAGYPVRDLGYEEVGEVVEIGAEVERVAPSLEPGTVVYGTWGHRTHAILSAEYARERVLPAGLDPIHGIWSHIGPIALNGTFDANTRIGETVAVFGLGVVGQVVAQLLARSGARVIGIDLHDARLELATSAGGVETALRADAGDVAVQIRDATDGRGADVSVEVAGSGRALHEAMRSTAYGGRVVAMGFHQGEASGLFLGEEFHHNRIALVSSQISGVAPELSRRWDRLRLVHTFMRLQAEGAVDPRPTITHTFPFERAAEAFERLDASPGDTLQVVLDFGAAAPGGTDG